MTPSSFDTVNELLKRISDTEKSTDIHELNQLNDNKSEALPSEEPIVILIPFKCTECGVVFSGKTECETHIQTMHIFSCPKCNYKSKLCSI